MNFSNLGGLLGGLGGALIGGVSSYMMGRSRDKATELNDAIIANNRKRQEDMYMQQQAEMQAAQDRYISDMNAQAAASQNDFQNQALLQLLATSGLAGPAIADPLARRKRPTQKTGPFGDLSMLNTGRARLLGN